MASFNTWIQPPKRRYRRIYKQPTYQNIYSDRGNWTGGEIGAGIQAGTNRSISAPVLSAWRGHPVSAAEMQALGIEEALQIYKIKFWDKIRADEIESQIIAEFAADMKSSTGNNKALQRALNDIGYSVAIDGQIGQQTIAALNAAQAAGKTPLLYNAHRQRMIEQYQPSNFASQLISQLNNDYPERAYNDPIFGDVSTSSSASAGLVLAAITAAILWYNR